jgi:uncharacterized protein
MHKTALFTAIFAVCLGVFLWAPGPALSKTTFITIGTGGVTGVYYPTGGAICKIVNLKRKEYKIRCTVESTGGSVFNINAVLSGDLDFGIAQSDRQYQAWEGIAEWKDKGPQKNLRSVFSIHPESVTLIAAEDSGIKTVEDLKGKRVNIGNPGSGQRQNAIDALEAYGIDWRKDIHAENVKADAAPSLLQDGRIDAFFYTVGHPNGNIKEATAGRRKVRFIPITKIDALLKKSPFYARSVIPIADYPGAGNKEDVPTFGVKATLVTSLAVPENVVYAVTKEVFENFNDFKSLHPAYSTLTIRSMLEGLTAPFHPGALKYYKQAGLIK